MIKLNVYYIKEKVNSMSCLLTDFSQKSENLFTEIWDNHKFDKIGIFVYII